MRVRSGTFGVFPAGFDHQAIYRGGTDYLLVKIALETLLTIAAQEGYQLRARALATPKLYQPPKL